MSRKPPLNWIRSFDAATRHASFTRAAQELNMTQAAVSKQVRALEDFLYCQLFHRYAHGLELTGQGRRYWQDTHKLIGQLDQVTAQFINRQQVNQLHLRCNISYSALVLNQQLKDFNHQYPEVSIKLNHAIWESDNFGYNSHIEIDYCSLKDFAPGDYVHLLSAGSLFPVAAAHLRMHEIAALPLIHVSGYYYEWNSWLEHAEHLLAGEVDCEQLRKLPAVAGHRDWFVDNSLVAYQLAAQGVGLALGRECLVKTMLDNGQLQGLCREYALSAGEGFVLKLTAQGQEHAMAGVLFEYLQGV
ncbi:MAG: LysR family transcriptional regulator [Thiolinea sp.]